MGSKAWFNLSAAVVLGAFVIGCNNTPTRDKSPYGATQGHPPIAKGTEKFPIAGGSNAAVNGQKPVLPPMPPGAGQPGAVQPGALPGGSGVLPGGGSVQTTNPPLWSPGATAPPNFPVNGPSPLPFTPTGSSGTPSGSGFATQPAAAPLSMPPLPPIK